MSQQKRREFLRHAGIMGAGIVTAGPVLKAQEKESNETKKAETTRLTILQTTDIHCQIHEHDELFWENQQVVYRKTGGYDRLATYIQGIRKKNSHVFLTDTGDMYQGSALSVKTSGDAISPILNELGYNLYLPGNWEVIYGKKTMQHLLGGLKAPKVCANMYHDLGEGKKGELIFPPYYIWTVEGVKIGFLGYTDHLVPIRQSPNYSKGILYTKPEENLAHYVDVLRNQEQCSMVIVLAHLGLSQQIHLANLEVCKGVDYIMGGDTHERVRKPIQCTYAKVVEPGAFGSFCGRLELHFSDGKCVREEYYLDEITASDYESDATVARLMNDLEQPFLQEIKRVVGYSKIPLYRYFVIENTIDTLILDALRWKMNNIDIVLSNGFRFCPPRTTPDQTGNIPITYGFIYDMLPVDSHIKTGYATGRQIASWLEKELHNVFSADASKRFGGWVTKFNGMVVTFRALGNEGNRIESIVVGNDPLEPEKVYSICACERDGDPADMICRMKQVKDTSVLPITLHQTLLDYLAANSPVNPIPRKFAQALDVPETLLSQVTGVPYQFH
ncbi:MAG: bifunctional metallophosphatase/5'-nucleotidase [Saprospiraceae bacterium]|jgi:2',3'-cyclic-nucleotide 2'-phosphodiesterase (5'-nucleotidase family)|nr:bifunctional metallophosphatase/5'-nucleotidase [Saprospiraceae bacterium]